MSEWKVIPSFPDYEMSLDGDIREVDPKGTWVDQYMGRAHFEEEKHPRVRLRRDGLPIANSVEELLYETYPHLKPKAEDPEPVKVVKVVKPRRVRKRRPKRNAGRATPYVDDLGPEWASIPGFMRYKINREGQVINRRSKQLLKLRVSSKGSPHFSLNDNDGLNVCRHPDTLLGLAFPDMLSERKIRKSAVMHKPGEWRPIPNRTKYEIHASGDVRLVSRHRVKTLEDEQGAKYVKLKTDGVSGFKKYYISDLLDEVYAEHERLGLAA